MARRRHHRRYRMKRRGGKKRTTVRAVFTAINKYPRGKGASVREIHRIITKTDKGPDRRTLSSVKLAIARAVRMGSIKAPKGWQGFRGIPVTTPKMEKERRNAKKNQQQNDAKMTRSAEKIQQGKVSMPWFSSEKTSAGSSDYGVNSGSRGDTWGRSRSRGDGPNRPGARNLSRKETQSATRRERARSPSRGARSQSRGRRPGGRRGPGRPRGRGKKDLRKKKARHANSSNSSNINSADASDNCGEEGNEGVTQSSLWPSYCAVS